MPATDSAIIILAAGNSSRLGTPKQLLMYNGKTLLQHATDQAVISAVGEVVVVTGAGHHAMASSVQKDIVSVVQNEQWSEGMGSSVQAGLSFLLSKQPALQSVIIMLCDQPFVSSSLLKEMVAKRSASGKGIVACVYKETIGVPALFTSRYFSALLSLPGTEGAKKIITAHADDVAAVPFSLGAVDIDTMDDYKRLLQQ